MTFQTALSYYQTHYPHLSQNDHVKLYANEAFLRRASMIGSNFMIKGSFVTREYMDMPSLRYPVDLDFVAMTDIQDSEKLALYLSKWVNAVTAYPCHDDVVFEVFDKHHTDWEINNYPKIVDDFETVFQTLYCTINHQKIAINLEISINLPIYRHLNYISPISINTALDTLYFEYSPSLEAQIAWKIDQTIIYPRIKDLYDLSFMINYVNHDLKMIDDIMKIIFYQLKNSFYERRMIAPFFTYNPLKYTDLSCQDDELNELKQYYPHLTTFDDLFYQFQSNMQNNGFTFKMIEKHYPFLLDNHKLQRAFDEMFQ